MILDKLSFSLLRARATLALFGRQQRHSNVVGMLLGHHPIAPVVFSHPVSDALPLSKDYGRHLFVSVVPIPKFSSFEIKSPLHHGKILVAATT